MPTTHIFVCPPPPPIFLYAHPRHPYFCMPTPTTHIFVISSVSNYLIIFPSLYSKLLYLLKRGGQFKMLNTASEASLMTVYSSYWKITVHLTSLYNSILENSQTSQNGLWMVQVDGLVFGWLYLKRQCHDIFGHFFLKRFYLEPI